MSRAIEILATVAVAIVAVNIAALIRLERQFFDGCLALGAFEAESADIMHLNWPTRTLSVVVHVSTNVVF
ncbi:MAG: hypothetical protein V1738_06995 [Patescibacteria group bacterium]